MIWLGSFDGASQAVAANTIVESTQSGAMGASDGEPGDTLIRTRGSLLVFATGTADADVMFGVGLIELNFPIPVGTNLPGPLTEGDDDWIWHQVVPLRVDTSEQAAVKSANRIEIDSKAMRKLEGNSALVWVLQTVNDVGTAGVRTFLGARYLLKKG